MQLSHIKGCLEFLEALALNLTGNATHEPQPVLPSPSYCTLHVEYTVDTRQDLAYYLWLQNIFLCSMLQESHLPVLFK